MSWSEDESDNCWGKGSPKKSPRKKRDDDWKRKKPQRGDSKEYDRKKKRDDKWADKWAN